MSRRRSTAGLRTTVMPNRGCHLSTSSSTPIRGSCTFITVPGVCHGDVKPQNVMMGRAFGWESSSVFWSRSCCSCPSHCTPSGKISNHVDSLASLCSILLTSCGIMYEAL
ncbi:unnamed protein product [Triticum turgidum subsp. durum]|uniref:Protein kinase domain-containing protein n=1 Tax=Triticum turgidum subsp. durum TaxID=4567 RepID=A0A9R0UU69_TRITD|nr:unnamed protein product [Triticum turgidum subsp. durum]